MAKSTYELYPTKIANSLSGYNLMPTIDQQITQEEARIKSTLGNFSSTITNDQKSTKESYNYKIRTIQFDECRLVAYVLEHLLNCKTAWLPIEKVHWWSSFSYDGVYCSIAHQKFGFNLYISGGLNKDDADELAEKLISELETIVATLSKVTTLYAKKAVKVGNIILHNKMQSLEDRYVYYRDASFVELDTKAELDSIMGENDGEVVELGVYDDKDDKDLDKKVAETMERLAVYRRKSSVHLYNQEVAIIYFLSLIEHICLLLYAFNHDGGNVVDLAMKGWGEKFEKVIGTSDKDIEEGYLYLRKVALYKRNPITHGFLTPKMTEASFYFKQARQRTPINLFNGELLGEYSYGVDLTKLDKLLADIRKNPKFHNAMRYIENSEFDISYDTGSMAEFELVNKMTESDLVEYLDAVMWRYNNAANMDW